MLQVGTEDAPRPFVPHPGRRPHERAPHHRCCITSTCAPRGITNDEVTHERSRVTGDRVSVRPSYATRSGSSAVPIPGVTAGRRLQHFGERICRRAVAPHRTRRSLGTASPPARVDRWDEAAGPPHRGGIVPHTPAAANGQCRTNVRLPERSCRLARAKRPPLVMAINRGSEATRRLNVAVHASGFPVTRSARLTVGALAALYLLWLVTWLVLGDASYGPSTYHRTRSPRLPPPESSRSPPPDVDESPTGVSRHAGRCVPAAGGVLGHVPGFERLL